MIRTCASRPEFRHGRHDGHSDHPAGRRLRRQARWRPHVPPGTWQRLARELALIATLAAAYEVIGRNMVQSGATAASHAMLIVDAERALGLFREQSVQAAVIGNDTVTDAFNAYYGGTHFLVPALVLAWLLLRHPAHYGRARTSLAAATALGFTCFWLFPVAPPRLLPARYGIVDTLVTPDGSGHLDSILLNSAGDVYASMPSLHVAWATWAALALFPVIRHPALRALAVAYPLMTTLVVVATGNHYFLDTVAGAALACGTWLVTTRATARLTVEFATRRPSHRRIPATPAVPSPSVPPSPPIDTSPPDAPRGAAVPPAAGGRPARRRPRAHSLRGAFFLGGRFTTGYEVSAPPGENSPR